MRVHEEIWNLNPSMDNNIDIFNLWDCYHMFKVGLSPYSKGIVNFPIFTGNKGRDENGT